MAKKKNPKPKKLPPHERGFIDQFTIVIDHILSYFQIFFIYLRKKFNHNLRISILFLFSIFYLFFIYLAGTGFLIYSIFLLVTKYLEDPVLSTFAMALILLTVSSSLIYLFLKKIEI